VRIFPFVRRVVLPAIAITAVLGTVSGVSAGRAGVTLADVRQATVKYQNLSAALRDGYGRFYICTDNETRGVGAMGQHFVKGSLVGDPEIDPLHPEALMYAPKPGGGWKFVGMEYVVIKADWDAVHPGTVPTVLGQRLRLVPAGNRYGLPDFYERHLWLWRNNPSGIFQDWNPKVSCRGTGDPA
jgi:hypothetical protein